MKTLKFKEKVKKKCKDFLAVTLLSSSLLLSNVSCDKKEDIYGNYDEYNNDNNGNNSIVDDDIHNTNTNENTNENKNENGKESADDFEKDDTDMRENNEDLDIDEDEDIVKIDNEILEDDNDFYEEPDEGNPFNKNTGTKYIVSSEAIRKEYEKDCFNYIKLAKLLAEHCESPDKIDIETPGGKCYVPYYLTSNSPFQATSSCEFKKNLKTAEGSIKAGIHKSHPDVFNGRLELLRKRLIYSYIIHEKINQEDIRNVVTYPYDNMDEKYLIPNFNNSFEFNNVPYKMLNEHLDVLHEMEFINTLTNHHTRYKFSNLWFYSLGNSVLFTLDLMKCPMENDKEASIAVLAFSDDRNILEKDPKYQKFINGECDEYFDKITEEYIKEVESNN